MLVVHQLNLSLPSSDMVRFGETCHAAMDS